MLTPLHNLNTPERAARLCELLRLELLTMAVLLPAASVCVAQGRVEPVYATPAFPNADVDSVAVWVAPDPADSLLFVTEKALDRVEVWYAATGLPYEAMPFLGGEPDSVEAGEFDRPNAVWVVYHVPFRGGFVDVLLVTEQNNGRVQVFRLPELSFFGEFARGELSTEPYYGRGLGPYHDSTDHYVFVTDNSRTNKVKKYRLFEDGDLLGAELVSAFGEETGPGALDIVESLLVDPVHDRLHICGDEGGDFIRVYDLDGRYTGLTYGERQFEFDEEGIVLYDTGGGAGYVVVSDQFTNGEPNEYEIFDRVTLEHLGCFESPEAGEIVTTNTDGVYLCRRPLPGFPNGAFYAVNDDANAHVYDWTDIAEVMGLDIVALDRPFVLGGDGPPASAQRCVWRHDGSWWGVFATSRGLEIERLEDGTFASMAVLDEPLAAEIAVEATGDSLLVLAAGETARLYVLTYQASRRRYLSAADPISFELGGATNVALRRDVAGRIWISWVEDRRLRVAWSEANAPALWGEKGVELGSSRNVAPELVRLSGELLLLGANDGGATEYRHVDAMPPEEWTTFDSFGGGAVDALSTVAGEGRVTAALSQADGLSVWSRQENGDWRELGSLPPGASSPALSLERTAGGALLFYTDSQGAYDRLLVRSVDGADGSLEPAQTLLAVPGVDMGPPFAALEIPVEARDAIVACRGSDGIGYFARVGLETSVDRTPPITMQHEPQPGAVAEPESDGIFFRLTDDLAGIDRSALKIFVDGKLVPHQVRGVPRNLLVSVQLPEVQGVVHVRIEAADTAEPANIMAPFEYAFAVSVELPMFRRGDVNADGRWDVSDPVFLLLFLFLEGQEPSCEKSGDANDDGTLDISDGVYLLDSLFLGGSPPGEPFRNCGTDPTLDPLSCQSFAPCDLRP